MTPQTFRLIFRCLMDDGNLSEPQTADIRFDPWYARNDIVEIKRRNGMHIINHEDFTAWAKACAEDKEAA